MSRDRHLDEAPELAKQGAAGPETASRALQILELLIAFVIGAVLMTYIYLDPRGLPAAQIGAPGYDSFYHVKMAVLLPKIGLVHYFPWLQYVYFSRIDYSFISHHYGFHVLLVPFVYAAKALGADYLTGGRWAISFFFGMNLLLMDALLMHLRVRWRWLWLILFLVLPADFFVRHAYIRAISPSLMFMLLVALAMFKQRPVLSCLAVIGYTHLYLGSVVYSPVLIGAYALACGLASQGERSSARRIVLWAMLGWFVGLRTHPYFRGALEFLEMQVFGTGLDPDIPVGSEWGSYGNVWSFAVGVCGPVLGVWTLALVLRVCSGRRLDAKEATLLILNVAFLALTLKAKRFIEYWPAFCLLSAACLATPFVNPVASWFDPLRRVRVFGAVVRAGIALLALAVVVIAAAAMKSKAPLAAGFLREWPTWVFLAALCVAVAVGRAWLRPESAPSIGQAVLDVATVLACCAVFAAASLYFPPRYLPAAFAGRPQLDLNWIGWIVGALAVGALLYRVARRMPRHERPAGFGVRALGAGTTVFIGAFATVLAVLVAALPLAARQREVKCGFDLPAIRGAMNYLKDVSKRGDIVFTDDWDVFPVYFYHNDFNYYIVGLDPTFTHAEKPELWERFVRITRGEVPRTYEASWTGDDGKTVRRVIHVELTDIRNYFHARFVITDRDHKALAAKLAQASDYAELIYPETNYDDCRNVPYLIFRINNSADAPALATETEP